MCSAALHNFGGGRWQLGAASLKYPRSLGANQNFAVAHRSVVDEQAIAIRAGIDGCTGGTALQTHTRRRLKNVGGKRAALRVEFDLQVARVRIPGDLVAGIEGDDFGNDANEYELFGQASPFVRETAMTSGGTIA